MIIEEDERQIILTEHLELHIIEARKKLGRIIESRSEI